MSYCFKRQPKKIRTTIEKKQRDISESMLCLFNKLNVEPFLDMPGYVFMDMESNERYNELQRLDKIVSDIDKSLINKEDINNILNELSKPNNDFGKQYGSYYQFVKKLSLSSHSV